MWVIGSRRTNAKPASACRLLKITALWLCARTGGSIYVITSLRTCGGIATTVDKVCEISYVPWEIRFVASLFLLSSTVLVANQSCLCLETSLSRALWRGAEKFGSSARTICTLLDEPISSIAPAFLVVDADRPIGADFRALLPPLFLLLWF